MIANATEAEIFGRVFEPKKVRMTPDAARSIVELDFSTTDRKRMDRLAEKARLGTLTKKEDEELENYIRVGHLLSIMQSKARKVLHGETRKR